MSPSGFSTGALARGDFYAALQTLEGSSADAVELSAIRLSELRPLIEALASLDLRKYKYVSVHAPSSFSATEEVEIIGLLVQASLRGWYVIVHPDSMHEVERWAVLGSWLCLENMDKRKPVGRTAEELRGYFARLPLAGLCFDIAHARQVDSSMIEAYRLIRAFYKRIRQVHISEVSTSSRHARISAAAASDFREVAVFLPPEAALIVEAPVLTEELESELAASRAAVSSVPGDGIP
jgi:hypothetical protein